MNVSLIVACKNRYKPLSISLQSWLHFKEIKEIIIVDWDSEEPLSHLTELDSRIKVVKVPNKKYFNQPQPLNLAASLAKEDFLLKVDSDYIMNPYYNFFESYPIDDSSFVSGFPNCKNPEYIQDGMVMLDYSNMSLEEINDYCNIYSAYFKSLYGLLFVKKENFLKCGGFNEDLGKYYGFEDEEFHGRLQSYGLEMKKINYDYNLIHIPHQDSKRIEYFKGSHEYDETVEQMKNNIHQYYSGDTAKHQLEYAIAQYHPKKNKELFGNPLSYYIEPKTKWNIKKVDDQNYIATEMNNLENFPPVYYVTLEDSTERQQELEKEFERYGVIPKAIKSKRFSESDDIITGKYVYQLSGPTQGCIVSHLKAVKSWYESNESDYAFFCEDDLSLKTVDYWNFKWEEFIERLPEGCECVQLMTIRGDFDGVYFRDRAWDDWSETAYIMNRDYAKKLIDNYCVGDTFHLELKDSNVMPIGENILFTNIGKVYTFPLFVENVEISTTDVNDPELENGQKPNHIYSSEYVYDWWKDNGKNYSIDDLMNPKKPKKHFEILDEKSPTSTKHNIVDCFCYFNEKELLELRVNLLKDYVDKFIIVDGNYTHSGSPKEFTCKKVIKKLGLPEDIIEVIEVDLSDESIGPATKYEELYDPGRTVASRERVQRDSIAKCLETNQFDENTVFIVSDCDEIIDPQYISMLSNLARTNRDKIFKADLVNLEGRADLRSYDKNSDIPTEWRYSLFVCLKEQMEKVNLTYIRAGSTFNPYPIVWPYTEGGIKDGVYIDGQRMSDLGWHFTWMGDDENRFLKSQTSAYSSYDFDFLVHRNFLEEKDKWKEFFTNYKMGEEEIPPSGNTSWKMKPYPVENLPHIIFDLPRVKKFLLPDTNTIMNTKTELEQLLHDYSLDTENPEHNFNLGVWYENEGHTAPALSYFLRCAERATESDPHLAYEALIRGSYCYEKQGTRDGSARSLLWQAQMFLPERPEAYYLLARFAKRREWWQDCYSTCDLCLRFCNFDSPALRTNVEYLGQYGLLFEKAISGWWWGKGDESRSILNEILLNHQLNEKDYNTVCENIKMMNGTLPEDKNQINFAYSSDFDWSSLSYEDQITIDREVVHEKVYRFWEDVKEGDVVLDVGASVGAYVISILDQKPRKVYCVEPSKKLLKVLAKNCSEKVFDYSENPLVYINRGIVDQEGDKINIFGGEEEFIGTTFNQMIRDYSIDHVDFMKIDCEGGEYSIFRDENMSFLLNKVKFIAMEVHLNYEGCREKFKNFRDKYLTQFSDYKVMSCTRQSISWGNSLDLKDNIFDNKFIDDYTCEFMIYIKNQ